MYKDLDDYLKEISHYLSVDSGSEDIIKEIKSHILEKVEDKFGKIEQSGIQEVIKEYGSPREVASKYMEGNHIIEPSFKNYLFLYTGILYAIHVALYIVALIFEIDIFVAPLIYISKVDYYNIIFSLLSAFVFDFGLVCLYLFIVTKKHLKTELKWFNGFNDKKRSSSIMSLIISILVFAIGIYYMLRFDSIFIVFQHNEKINLISKNLDYPQYSLLILIAVGISIIYQFMELCSNVKLPQIILLFSELFILSFISKPLLNVLINFNVEEKLGNNILNGLKILFAIIVIKIIIDLVKKLINFNIKKAMDLK
ncbi:MAG: conserved rane protein of unknown function [Clostridiaceae bacterium]|jgi:hypothetical protein|nr:conserved rane protein of unknown function [Clostridiaceae bacterium]